MQTREERDTMGVVEVPVAVWCGRKRALLQISKFPASVC